MSFDLCYYNNFILISNIVLALHRLLCIYIYITWNIYTENMTNTDDRIGYLYIHRHIPCDVITLMRIQRETYLYLHESKPQVINAGRHHQVSRQLQNWGATSIVQRPLENRQTIIMPQTNHRNARDTLS